MLLYIIRHGEPGSDGALTEKGWAQAESVGKRMAQTKIDKIFTSPVLRAVQTSEPACKLLGLTAGIEEWAHEIGDERMATLPDGTQKSVSLIQNTIYRENGNQELSFNDAYTCPGFRDSQMKKSVDYISENGYEFLERLGYRYENGVYRIVKPNDDKVALFCHSAFSKAWISVLLHIPIHIMWSGFDYEHSGVSVIEFENTENGFTAPTCLRFSDTSHLYADGIEPLIYDKVEM